MDNKPVSPHQVAAAAQCGNYTMCKILKEYQMTGKFVHKYYGICDRLFSRGELTSIDDCAIDAMNANTHDDVAGCFNKYGYL